MADLEAHPIADVPSEAQQETAKPANEADQAPADAQPPVDVEAAAESPDDAPRHSVLKEIPPQAVSATSPAALPPKAPRTRLPDGQVMFPDLRNHRKSCIGAVALYVEDVLEKSQTG